MAGLFLLGILTAVLGALLQPWFLRLGVSTLIAGQCFLVLGVGILTGLLIGGRLPSFFRRGVRAGFIVSGALASAGLLMLAFLQGTVVLLPSLLVLGLATGALAQALSNVYLRMLTPGRSATLFNLSGFSWGAGSVVICIATWASLNHLTLLLSLLSILPAVMAISAGRSRLFEHWTATARTFSLDWRGMAQPVTLLIAFALLLQAAVHWVVAGWLALYLTRRLGVTAGMALWTLALYWCAHSCARVAAVRLPRLEERARSLVAATLANLAGSVFLLRSLDLSGVTAGALLLGAGTGILYPLTVNVVVKRYPFYHPSFLSAHVAVYLVGGVSAAWLISPLAESLGIEVVIWFVLSASALIFVLLAVFFVESRLTAEAMALE
jgi:hypothetical protein